MAHRAILPGSCDPIPEEHAVAAARHPLTMLREFLRQEAAGGVLLVLAAALALVLANSPAAPAYTAALNLPVVVRAGGVGLDEPLLHWINDGLMAVLFLLVGLEIKREALKGQLSRAPKAALPGIAALGDMAAPAAVYLLDPEPLGIALGLLVGKQAGVLAATSTAVQLGLGALPEEVGWRWFHGMAVLCGIGFTMSLFIGSLAFRDPLHAAEVRLGVLAGSLLSALLGYALLRTAPAWENAVPEPVRSAPE